MSERPVFRKLQDPETFVMHVESGCAECRKGDPCERQLS